MARPSEASSYQPIGNDPDLQSARLAAINQIVAPDTPEPQPEHPAVTFARNMLSPLTGAVAPMGPQGPTTSAEEQDMRIQRRPPDFMFPGSFNPVERYGLPQGTLPPMGAQGPLPPGGGGSWGGEGAGAEPAPSGTPFPGLFQTPVLGGALRYARGIIERGPLGEQGPVALAHQAGEAERTYGRESLEAQAARQATLEAAGTLALGTTLSTAGKGPLGQRIASRAAEIAPSAAANEALAAAKGAEFQPGTGAALKPEPGPRYTVEVGKTRSVIKDTTTGETLPMAFTKEEAAQAKAAQLNAPTPAAGIEVPQEAALTGALRYVTRAKANEAGDSVADVVRRAARTNPEVVTPDFLAGQPEVRAQLDQALLTAKVPTTDENAAALAGRLLGQEAARPSVGNLNAERIKAVLGVPETEIVPAGPGGNPPMGPGGPIRMGGGAMPPDQPLPFGPPKSTAAGLAMEALRFATDIPRSLMVIGHLPILRQGLPLMADAVVRGNPAEIPLALGRAISAVSDVNGLRSAAITQGFRDTLQSAGIQVGRLGVHISDPLGPIAAREEFGLHSFLARVPVIANLNRAYPTILNSLRTGAAVDLAKMYEQSGRAIDSAKIGHFVNVASGRGDIPAILDTPTAREALSGVFFGPRLTTASWQMATDTLGALRDVGSDLLSRRRLDPTEIAQVRTTAAYVATGVGIMKLANSFGMNIGTDPTKTDFGRITVPDGKRVDLWGPFNENARLVAREIAFLQGTLKDKPGYGATTGADLLVSYIRSKLNAGLPTAVGDLLFGSTAGGETISEAYGTSEALRAKLLPLPFGVQEAVSGSAGGVGLQAAETGLVTAGATVIDTPPTVHYDGVGAPDTSGDFGKDPVLQEYTRLQSQDPKWKSQTALQPPNTVIGSGRNEFKLDKTSAAVYVQAVGEARRKELSALIYSPKYQDASLTEQEKMYDAAVSKADNQADRQFLAHGVIDSTDPKIITAEAVAGFHAQQQDRRQEAYWVALLDRAGKLTPDVSKAIDESNRGRTDPITVTQYLHDAPLIHEYLSHVPYGTDSRPIGTQTDWAAVAQAKVAQTQRARELTRSGVNPTVAEERAKAEILRSLTVLVQKNLFLNGAQLENPQRKLLSIKNSALATYFRSHSTDPTEGTQEYRNYPFAQ